MSNVSTLALAAFVMLALAPAPGSFQTTPTPATRSPVLYTVLAPKMVHPFSTYQVSVTIEPRDESASPRPGPVSVVASIVHNNTKYYKSEPVTIQPGSTVFVPIVVGDHLNHERLYNLTIEGTTSGSTKLIFEDVSEVRVQRKTAAVFVQTDKVIYKPGETVRFRVVVLDRELKPFADSPVSKTAVTAPPLINVIVFDSRRNVIKIWKGESVPGGIFSSNLTLSTEPVLGDWSIQAQVVNSGANSSLTDSDSLKTHSFAVDQYVLPKFNVGIVLPPFATFNASKITVQVKASYTYGKPVGEGDVMVTISEANRAYYQHMPPLVAKNFQLQNGVAFVDFDLVKELNLNVAWDRKINIEASVVESLTGKRQNGTSHITVYKHPYKLALLPGAENYKPGFPFTVTIRVTTQDDVPVSDPSPDALVVKHAFSWKDEGSVFKAPIPVTGLVRFTFETPSNELLNIHGFEATYKGVKQWFSIPEKIITESKTYLQLSVEGEEETQTVVQVGQELQVKVESNKPFNAVYYQLVGSGQLLTHGKKSVSASSKQSTLQVQIPAAAAPTAHLIVYVVSPDEEHEITSDSIKINTESRLNNYLNVTLSNNTREPGQDVVLDLKTRPTSLVALRGVDQSVLLLKEDKDLDLQAVNDELRQFDNRYYGHYYGQSYSYRVFAKSGLVVLTNAKIYRPRNSYDFPSPYPINDEYAPSSPPLQFNKIASAPLRPSAVGFAAGAGGRPSPQPPAVRVRTHFPETWLWEEVHTDQVTRLNKTVPDTLTSWVITGYSIHSEYGLGVLESPEKLTVVRPFFVTLNVPHSAVKGEVLAVQVLVHNYLSHDAEVTVSLDNSRQQFEFFQHPRKTRQINSGDAPTQDQHGVKTVQVGSSNVGTVTFIIVPSQFGTIELAVKGVTDFAGDALSRPLVVKPPGQLQTMNKVALVDHRNADSSSVTLETSFPEDRVAGADKVRISVVSDILGPTIANLDNLLQMPSGCGEQNLVNFVPDIVILDYLTKTHGLTPEIKSKALKYLESGYQRQLTYVHDDGSFSAFGKSDQYGSTWLTAFTIKSFYAAKPYITVDDEVIRKGLSFLTRQQSANGSFNEPGRVLHSGLQGGSSKGIALTAYVLLTFIETANSREVVDNATVHQTVIEKGLAYLVSEATEDSRDVYGLVLTSYVLELANHTKRDQGWALVEKHAIATTDGELKYWEQPPEPEPSPAPSTSSTSLPFSRPVPYKPKTKPVSVEMSSYRLLTYLAHQSDDLGAALPIVKWLLTKRNAAGGFISTQDTVVGLSALGKFAGFTHSASGNRELSLDITAKYAPSADPKVVHVRRENAIVLQSFELPNSTQAVTFDAKGHGLALVQLTNTFYVENTEAQQAFSVYVKVSSPALKELKLDVCTQFNRNDKTPSNMAVVEVNLPTGYTFDTDRLSDLRSAPKVMRYDITESDSQVNIYYDSLNSDKSCVSLYANLVFRVAKLSPSYVRVYDYYDTTRSGKANYESPKLDLCEVEGEEKENCI